MIVRLLVPDQALPAPRSHGDAGAFAKMLDGLSGAFQGAEHAENAFAAGTGDLQHAMYERARADVLLAVAVSGAQRAAQSLQTILNMQV